VFAAYKAKRADDVKDAQLRILYFDPKSNDLVVSFGSGNRALKLGFFNSVEATRAESELSRMVANGDTLANMVVRRMPEYVIRHESQRLSYADVLEHADPNQVRGKIVIVGCAFEGKDVYDGLWVFEHQAEAINTLLTGVVIKPVARSSQFALMVILSLVGVLLKICTRRLSSLRVVLVLIAVVLLYVGGAVYLYAKYGLLLNSLYHIIVFFLTYCLVAKLERRYLK